jgi:hypothetical protein
LALVGYPLQTKKKKKKKNYWRLIQPAVSREINPTVDLKKKHKERKKTVHRPPVLTAEPLLPQPPWWVNGVFKNVYKFLFLFS